MVASIWHTVVLVGILLALSVYGAHASLHVLVGPRKLLNYGLMVAIEWMLVGFVVWGTKRTIGFKELVARDWKKFREILRDIGIAILFLLTSYVVLIIVTLLLRPGHSVRLERILPHTYMELGAFMVVALTAGIAEEIIFRGYLQKQSLAIFGNELAGIISQAILFGASHGYQGTKRMVLLGIFGCLFGVLAQWRKSLRPGMIAHAVNDALGGLVFFLRQ